MSRTSNKVHQMRRRRLIVEQLEWTRLLSAAPNRVNFSDSVGRIESAVVQKQNSGDTAAGQQGYQNRGTESRYTLDHNDSVRNNSRNNSVRSDSDHNNQIRVGQERTTQNLGTQNLSTQYQNKNAKVVSKKTDFGRYGSQNKQSRSDFSFDRKDSPAYEFPPLPRSTPAASGMAIFPSQASLTAEGPKLANLSGRMANSMNAVSRPTLSNTPSTLNMADMAADTTQQAAVPATMETTSSTPTPTPSRVTRAANRTALSTPAQLNAARLAREDNPAAELPATRNPTPYASALAFAMNAAAVDNAREEAELPKFETSQAEAFGGVVNIQELPQLADTLPAVIDDKNISLFELGETSGDGELANAEDEETVLRFEQPALEKTTQDAETTEVVPPVTRSRAESKATADAKTEDSLFEIVFATDGELAQFGGEVDMPAPLEVPTNQVLDVLDSPVPAATNVDQIIAHPPMLNLESDETEELSEAASSIELDMRAAVPVALLSLPVARRVRKRQRPNVLNTSRLRLPKPEQPTE